jgi:TolB-like protein
MSGNPKNLSQFWQELKRRKVVRVITVYTAAAFVILELVDIITEPFGLPDWTLKLVVVLLSVGLIVSMILSWIYDVSPDGGLEKTKPAQKAQPKNQLVSSGGWKIASYISFVVILALIAINLIPRDKQSNELAILEKSIAVLPFTNLSEEKGNEHFADGLVEDLLNRISVIEELKVISRTSSEMYRERGVKSVPEIAGELDVSYIMEGSVRRYGDKARITVQLIDAINDDHIWAENYDRDIVDVFQTQSDIAMQIASELNAILTSEQKSHMQESKTHNVKAFELYQMGRFFWNKRTFEGSTASIEYFEKAIDEDRSYGLAYAGLADAYSIMASHGWMDRREGKQKAGELALKALELDGNLAEAYAVLGNVYNDQWEWEKAEIAYKQALEINPNYSIGHEYYAHLLINSRRTEEARKHIDIALELDPLSFIIRIVSARFYYHTESYVKALEELQKCNELIADHPWVPYKEMVNYFQLGDDENAFEALKRMLNLSTIYDLKTADKIYKAEGFRAVLEWKVEIDIQNVGNEHVIYYLLADSFGMIGEDEKALYWLNKAYEAHETTQMNWNLHFKNLRNTPGYLAIMKGMGLEN